MDDSPVEQESRNRTIKSVETSIAIIESLKELETAKVSELADTTGNSKANVYKHLNTLRKHEFVTREDNEYRLGLRYLDLGGFVRSQIDDLNIIKPRIAEVAERTKELCQYLVRDGRYSVIIYKESGSKGVSTRARVGYRYPIHQVASGKIMLAYMSRPEIEELISQYGLPAATENTLSNKKELYENLELIHNRGYAVNDEESTKGLYTVAVPIETPNQDLIGTCAVSGPVHRMREEEKIQQIIEIMMSVANEIELNLAHS